MTNPAYVALSRQIALSKALDGVANNIANADTTGFRREGAIFSEYVHAVAESQSLSQTRIAGREIDETPGSLRATGAPLDVAIEGEGYFVVLTARGERLTRAGNFSMNAEGALVTSDGERVAGEGGTPIDLPLGAREIVIATDGAIAADGAPVARLAVATAPVETLAREGSGLFRTTAGLDYSDTALLRQGFLESSNVDPVFEISRLIEVQRAFELNQQILNDEHERVRGAVETIGGRAG